MSDAGGLGQLVSMSELPRGRGQLAKVSEVPRLIPLWHLDGRIHLDSAVFAIRYYQVVLVSWTWLDGICLYLLEKIDA